MEDACKQLELEFKKVCNDLDFVSHHLETKFRGGNSDAPAIPVDVISMIRRMQALELRLSSAKEKVGAIVEERKVVFDELTTTLLTNHKQLSNLSANMNGFVNYTSTEAANTGLTALTEHVDDVNAENNAPGGIAITLNEFEEAKKNTVSAILNSHFMDATGTNPLYEASSSSRGSKKSSSINADRANIPNGSVTATKSKKDVTIISPTGDHTSSHTTKSVKFPHNMGDSTINENTRPPVNFAAEPRRLSLNPSLRAKVASAGGMPGRATRRLSIAF